MRKYLTLIFLSLALSLSFQTFAAPTAKETSKIHEKGDKVQINLKEQ